MFIIDRAVLQDKTKNLLEKFVSQYGKHVYKYDQGK
jgi:hypothetical protein